MQALVKTAKGPGNIEVREVDSPVLNSPDWVIIKVKAAGVCGTDLHIWKDEFPYWPPVILGHEFAGEVVEKGSNVKNVDTGDRVVAEPHSLACGVCESCREGKIQICEHKRSPGWGINGAFTDYVAMPGYLLHKIPDEVSYEHAALCEPVAIAVHQVHERGRIGLEDTVVVTGAGPIGILSVLVAKESGAGKIIVTGINSCEYIRFAVAKQMGADHIINVEKEDPVKVVKDLTDGKGADVLIETSGSAVAVKQSVAMLKKCGKISAVGLTGKGDVVFPWNDAMSKVLDISFNFSSSYTSWGRALTLLATTKKNIDAIITHRASINDWEKVFMDLKSEKGIKALFLP